MGVESGVELSASTSTMMGGRQQRHIRGLTLDVQRWPLEGRCKSTILPWAPTSHFTILPWAPTSPKSGKFRSYIVEVRDLISEPLVLE